MSKPIAKASKTAIPLGLARRIGAASPKEGDAEVMPTLPIDWALYWAERDIHVFPCASILGTPLIAKWYSLATASADQIVEWWSQWRDADIGAVPQKSGHFVIAITGDEGEASLAALEEKYGRLTPDFETATRWNSRHLWFSGRALSSTDLLGNGIKVMGPGRFVFMPDTLAPDYD